MKRYLLLLCLAACSSSGSGGSNTNADASTEIATLIAAVCQRNAACNGPSFSETACVVTTEDTLVGSPAECPTSQEIACLKEAAALPCADAGGSAQGTAIETCAPCFPPHLEPDASASHPVDANF